MKFEALEVGQKALEKRQESLGHGQMVLGKKFDRFIVDETDFFHQTWAYIDEIKILIEKRIKKLEGHLGLSSKN